LLWAVATFDQGPNLRDQRRQADGGNAWQRLEERRLWVGGNRIGEVAFQASDLGVEQPDLRDRAV